MIACANVKFLLSKVGPACYAGRPVAGSHRYLARLVAQALSVDAGQVVGIRVEADPASGGPDHPLAVEVGAGRDIVRQRVHVGRGRRGVGLLGRGCDLVRVRPLVPGQVRDFLPLEVVLLTFVYCSCPGWPHAVASWFLGFVGRGRGGVGLLGRGSDLVRVRPLVPGLLRDINPLEIVLPTPAYGSCPRWLYSVASWFLGSLEASKLGVTPGRVSGSTSAPLVTSLRSKPFCSVLFVSSGSDRAPGPLSDGVWALVRLPPAGGGRQEEAVRGPLHGGCPAPPASRGEAP